MSVMSSSIGSLYIMCRKQDVLNYENIHVESELLTIIIPVTIVLQIICTTWAVQKAPVVYMSLLYGMCICVQRAKIHSC